MREILFRGKNEYGEWLEGLLLWWHDTEDVQITQNKKPPKGGSYTQYIIPETVGQYTGLTDKNGKKIFEGDVVAGALYWQERPKNGLVAFRDGSFGLIWYRGEVEQFNPFTSMCNVEYEVIGNIHDNPELLKGGAK